MADAGDPVGADRGYVTLAVGNPRYLELAVDMRLSMREQDDLPVALVADERLAAAAEERYPGVFDAVTVLPERFRAHRGIKYGVAIASPYERNIFIDSDCIVMGSLDRFWEALEGEEMALVGRMLEGDDEDRHHGFSTIYLRRRFGVDAYLKSNTGVFYFRKSAAVPILEECLELYVEEILPKLRGGFLGDELAFALVGGRRRLATFPEPGPIFWRDELARLDPERPQKPVMHMIAPIPRDAMRRMLADVERRRRDAGLPTGSSAHWRWKMRKVLKALWGDKVFRPFAPLMRLLRISW